MPNNSPTIIEFYTRNVYGRDTLYIRDNATAFQFARLTGKKSITREDMSTCTALFGVSFVEVIAPAREIETPRNFRHARALITK